MYIYPEIFHFTYFYSEFPENFFIRHFKILTPNLDHWMNYDSAKLYLVLLFSRDIKKQHVKTQLLDLLFGGETSQTWVLSPNTKEVVF